MYWKILNRGMDMKVITNVSKYLKYLERLVKSMYICYWPMIVMQSCKQMCMPPVSKKTKQLTWCRHQPVFWNLNILFYWIFGLPDWVKCHALHLMVYCITLTIDSLGVTCDRWTLPVHGFTGQCGLWLKFLVHIQDLISAQFQSNWTLQPHISPELTGNRINK